METQSLSSSPHASRDSGSPSQALGLSSPPPPRTHTHNICVSYSSSVIPSFSAENLPYLGVDMLSGVVSHPWTAARFPSAAGAGARAAVPPNPLFPWSTQTLWVISLPPPESQTSVSIPPSPPPAPGCGGCGCSLHPHVQPARVPLILEVGTRPLSPRDESCYPHVGQDQRISVLYQLPELQSPHREAQSGGWRQQTWGLARGKSHLRSENPHVL